MRVLVIGASGAIGSRLVPQLIEHGHEGFSRKLDRTFAPTNRLRTEGIDNLLAAARVAGVRRFVAQSFAPYRYAQAGRSRPRMTRSTPTRPRRRARPLPR